ncbi:fatty acid desaturase [Veronia pacifica]|uniref:Uncharacterized protein n=1 Tax=Veronia pacifica TaxID=1080227 RepID=A0A1C3E9B3_9GAMM|nr:fatty acid desaturase [Veronia pacifica]ODA29835.1 hypothetical protein A8L45_21610 [Veronia pacifica]
MSEMSNEMEKNYSDVWQHFMPDIAVGTVALFFAIVIGYVITILTALFGYMSYPIAAAICSYLAFASFTVMHDAGHGGIIKMGSKLKPLEDVLGWICSVPLVLVPYRFFQKIHDRHHAFTNDPDRDPDHFTFGKQWYMVLLNCVYIPFRYHWMSVTSLRNLKVFRDTYPSTIAYFAFMLSGIAIMVMNGFVIEFLTFILIPGIFAVIVLPLFFDYIPHHPHKSQDRFQNTRIFTGQLWNILLLGQSYHLIHHLYPRLPWYKYQDVFHEVLPELEAQGSPIESIGSGPRPGWLKSPLASGLKDGGKSINMLLEVASIAPVTDDSVMVSFALPPGERLQYRAGQYLTVSKWLNNAHQTRCYSICSSPESGLLQIGVRETKKGLMSGYINQTLESGNELIVRGPFGTFAFPALHSLNVSRLVLIAGGSGFTPILSILESAFHHRNITHVDLIYANRDVNSIMFLDEIMELKKKYGDRLSVNHVISRDPGQSLGVSGRLDREMLLSLLPELSGSNTHYQQDTDFYICGPEGMKQQMVDTLSECNVSEPRVHVEDFVPATAVPIGAQHEVIVNLTNGNKFVLKVASNQTILQVANSLGIGLPHACGNGTCGTCKFRVVDGEAIKIDNSIPGITEDEQKAGFTLVCQCKPNSPLVISEQTH